MFHRKNHPVQQNDVETTQLLVDAPVEAPVVPQIQPRKRPVFTGFEDHTITLEEASTLTRNYRMAAGSGAVKGRYFSRAALEQLLLHAASGDRADEAPVRRHG